MDKIIEKTMKNLKKNNMTAVYAESRSEVPEIIKKLVPAGSSVSNGGSVSLREAGVYDLLLSGDYLYYDRTGLSGDDIRDCYIKALSCDAYFCSSNAVTENGELYNVDGNSNRVACIAFGPKRVIMVVGKNKIVPDIKAAVERVKRTAAPKNAVRLSLKTPCAATGECMGLDGEICSGCASEGRICCSYLISAHQRQKGRITVIIVNEELGY